MSKETNLRYEQPHRPSKLFQEYTKQLQANDSVLINDIGRKEHDAKELHDKWFERSNIKLRAKLYQQAQNDLQQELKMVGKASMLVRKRALALRIEADKNMYAEELAQKGKSFHVQRV